MRITRSPFLSPPVWMRVPLGSREPEEHQVLVRMKRGRAEGVGSDVVEDGVGGAIFGFDVLVVVAALAGGEREVGEAEIGAVEHDDLVVLEDLHVHGGDANAFLEEDPVPASYS